MAKQASRNTNERVVFDKQVAANRGDIYTVKSKGTTIEFTDRFGEAESAYKDAGLPKVMFKILRSTGAVSKVREQIL